MNQVDISHETIDSEWELLAVEHGLFKSPPPEKPGATDKAKPGTGGLFDNMDGVEIETPDNDEQPKQLPIVSDDRKIEMAAVGIAGGLKFLFHTGLGWQVSEQSIMEVSKSYAQVICKYYQGGFFEFLEAWKEELLAIGATIILVKEIRRARAEKSRAEKAAQQVTPPKKSFEETEDTE